ncbi:Uroporphyrinogen decarboxylase [Parvularcula bermudensis HTCC2503]|uniref:Uroporphyrinogen decarboxylase n=1 Tax=Parvularcula bermudensis (strain ATCC BAA-594 / HTCC2503 / KCTC 12087) TaxID=314260 RepID=E0TES0_PARBH|nr:uroporphyrinogen decarboxylase [Parvularcula bermudensis]ADM08953.1 Uroporphyrinogen decarboxylase [Parvularcula bermudensis HTCC2503]
MTLLTSVLRGTVQEIPPIWFMRQAGRYLPEYRDLRANAGGFLDLCYTPEKAARVTLQPIDRYDLDAAILFADILLVPQALGMDLWFEPGEGPRLAPALAEGDAAVLFEQRDIHDRLGPIYETVSRVRAALPQEKALIGFAGAPWTVATYMLAGGSVKDPAGLRAVVYDDRERFAAIIDVLTDATIDYLKKQVDAGAEVIQLFDSWAGGLPEALFDQFCVAPVARIAAALRAHADIPVIGFPRGSGPLYRKIAALPDIAAVSIDTGMPADWAAEALSPLAVVQGGLDPLLIVKGGTEMLKAADQLRASFEGRPFVFNVGHGLVPQTPPENVAALVNHVRGR